MIYIIYPRIDIMDCALKLFENELVRSSIGIEIQRIAHDSAGYK